MDRRSFLTRATLGGGAAAAATALAAPLVAQEMPKLSWRMVSGFPKALDPLFGAAGQVSDHVRRATGGNFEIAVVAAGDAGNLTPGPEIARAVAAGRFEACHTDSGWSWEEDATYAIGAGLPFGLNARLANAWFYHRDGNVMLNGFYATQGLHALPAGNTGAQMGGWFRKEIAAVADLKGLRMRIGGIGGRVMARLGVAPQQLAAAAIRPALEKGSIDAAEWVGPHDDEVLRLNEVAPHYHYPGWWAGGATLHAMFNLDAWNALPATYQAILSAACQAVNGNMLAAYDAGNPGAIKRLVAAGAQLHPFRADVLSACFDAAQEVHAAIAAENPTFRTLLEHQAAFKKDAYLWLQLSELNFDSFMMAQDNAGRL